MAHSTNESRFDAHAQTYDADLHRALSVSGEDKFYFASGRVRWLARWLADTGLPHRTILDFGCGTGTAIPFFREFLHPEEILGVDVSAESLAVARSAFHGSGLNFEMIGTPHHEAHDVAFCNGVFHHIQPGDRQEALAYIFDSLRPGGIFFLFENNPWNPATRHVMSRCAFDDDAIPLSPIETRRRMKSAGFHLSATRYLFVFPAFLKALRFLERPLSPIPTGTQYVVIGKKEPLRSAP